MATPTLFGVVGVLQPADDLANQGLQDSQWQALSGQAIGRGGEASADQSGQVAHGGVAVEHLEDEDLDRNDGVEQARAPRVPGFSADLGDVFFREYASQICRKAWVILAIRGLLFVVLRLTTTPTSCHEATTCARPITPVITRGYDIT